MPNFSALPFSTNLSLDECSLSWAGREGHVLWPGKGGNFCYDAENFVRIDGIVSKRELPDLPGGGRWGSYSSLSPKDVFYFPTYGVGYDLRNEHGIDVKTVLDVNYIFTQVLGYDFKPSASLETRANFVRIKRDLSCASVLFSSWGGLRDKFLSRVESFVIEGAANPEFVKNHSETRRMEWLIRLGR